MKVFRRLFNLIIVLFFFLLGISAADKQYLSQSVVGICINTEDRVLQEQLHEFILDLCCTDIHDLYARLSDAGFDANLKITKRFFDENTADMGCFPCGIYDTIVIDLGDHHDAQRVYFKQLRPLSHRFGTIDVPFLSNVQSGYIGFLSLIGKTEKCVFDLFDWF